MNAYYIDTNAVSDDDRVTTTTASKAFGDTVPPAIGEAVVVIDADDNFGTAEVLSVEPNGCINLLVIEYPGSGGLA